MDARRLSARHGFLWLLAGFALFRRNPPLTTALTFGYLLTVIRDSIGIHRKKGTVWAVKRTLQVMGYGAAVITEGWQTMVGAPWVVGDATRVGGASHWAEYWVTITQAITPAMVNAIVRRLRAVAPARCRLTRIKVDSVLVAVGGPWLVGDVTVTGGATYPTEISSG